ncbi:MAG: methionine synthase [Alphaproteobacteria bacterium]|nr:methionine synthase [Alphaproteobacteria bacterium]
MERSERCILTTHVGSLIRSPELARMLIEKEQGRAPKPAVMAAAVGHDMDEVIRHQIDSGIDIGNDGEVPRIGLSTYVQSRMSGFGGQSQRNDFYDYTQFPKYRAVFLYRYHTPSQDTAKLWNAPQAVAELRYDSEMREVREECEAFSAALARQPRKFAETFMTAVSPGNLTCTLLNAYYRSEEDYVMAAARELKKEYDYIHRCGFLLQVDAPDLALERQLYFQKRPMADFIVGVKRQVAAINAAIADIPPERVRLHVCWGNYEGPHVGDVPLEDVLPLLYEAKVGELSIAFANPRHQHEYRAFKRYPLPKHLILIPGVIDVTRNYLEHPEVVADRICAAVEAVGDKTRVIAGTDFGFSTFTDYTMVAEDVCWAKFKALREGADLATRRLWH